MRGERSCFAAGRSVAAGIGLALGALLAGAAAGQPNLPGSAYPQPRLTVLTPAGAKAGTTVEVVFAGTDVEEPESLRFSHPGIKGEPIIPPTPPPDPKKKGPNPPRPPITRFKVTVAPDVPPGTYEARLVNRWGVSNARAFVVGDQNEVAEKEPNNDVDQAQRVEVNSTINGAITAPTDVDYFAFAGKKGQRVLTICRAADIDSRLEPAVEVYDARGRQLGFGRQHGTRPALVDVTLPADGDYLVRLYHFTHTQGSAEHFYRLSVTTAPWIDAVHPCAVEPGKTTPVTVYGRNLPGGQTDPAAVIDGKAMEKVTVPVNVPNDPARLQRLEMGDHLGFAASGLDGFELRLRGPGGTSNPHLLTYARAPVVLDNDSNHTPETAQHVPVPGEVAGRILKRRERDWYGFTAKKGDVLMIEAISDRLGSPNDLRLVLRNPAAKADVVDLDDASEPLNVKFFHRSADPPAYRFVVPADGNYQLLVMSTHGDTLAGPHCTYRVRITPEQPDFRLVVMPGDYHRPEACQLLQGGHQAMSVYVWRRDGFNGPVTLTIDGLPPGVTCPPQVLSAGQNAALLVVSAAPNAAVFTGEIKVKGTATIKGQAVVREARPGSITWPTQPGQNVPAVGRLERSTWLAVREKAPWGLTPTLEKPVLIQGDKTNLKVQLARLWPDFKQPLQVQVMEPIPNVTVNNNQPITLNPGKDDGVLPVVIAANALPGIYNVVLRGQAAVPFNKDPMAKQKPNANLVQVSAPVQLTVLPKQVATVALATPNPIIKVGAQVEVVVRVTRMYDYDGPFKVDVVLPPAAKGLSAESVTIPAGQNEAKFVLRAAPDTPPGGKGDLLVKATATVNGNVPVVQEVKFAANVVK
ncbi:MAG TPA: hypothetical protein VFA26_13185 [Gemmataceae bacterium]|nr:hypothetical protein [Gemmataceae bacterium]